MLCWEMIRGPGLDCLIFMKFYVNGDCQVKWKKVCLLDICNSMFPRVYCLFDFIEAEMFTLPGVVSNPPVLHVKLEDSRELGYQSHSGLSPNIKERNGDKTCKIMQ